MYFYNLRYVQQSNKIIDLVVLVAPGNRQLYYEYSARRASDHV